MLTLSLGEANIDELTGLPHTHHPTTGQPLDSNVHLRHPWDESAPAPPAQWRWRFPFWRGDKSEYEEVRSRLERSHRKGPS